MDRCPDPTPFPTVPSHGYRMKPLFPSRKACVLDHAQSSCASSINLSLLPAASHSDRVIVLPFCTLSHPRDPRRPPGTPVVRQNVPCTIERLKSHLRWDVGINFPTFRRAF